MRESVMLTKGDEYPIHQTAEPIAFSGTDRNFYDRFFFCGYRSDGSGYFGAAFGVYPHLNIASLDMSGWTWIVGLSELKWLSR